MVCPKCRGRGFYYNKSYPNPASWSYAGEATRKCGKCKESGFIIGNVKEVLEFLKYLKTARKLDSDDNKQLQDCINTIEKY